jgi:hypothetical protein
MKYYIIKTGVYDHGLYWMGNSLGVAIYEAKKLASEDEDDFHFWQVREGLGEDAEVVYECIKENYKPEKVR